MINEIRLRELFEEKLKSVDPRKHFLTVIYRWNFFEWFKFGFEAAYTPLLTFKTPGLTPEKEAEILRQLKDVRSCSTLSVEPDSKLIFVYSWHFAPQRTMIILADTLGVAPYNQLNMAGTWAALILSVPLYFGLYIYLDQIIPNTYGI